jgi:DNA processing protein
MTDDAALGYTALLAGLPHMAAGRLRRLLARHPAEQAWALATSGDPAVVGPPLQVRRSAEPADPADLARQWATHAGADPAAALAAHAAAGVSILLPDHPRFPAVLRDDPAPPAVLFALGAHDVDDRPAVAIVGTRRCTGVGAGFARELGLDLARAGVAVVSGLALGIDGAAHRGVLDAWAAGPVAAPATSAMPDVDSPGRPDADGLGPPIGVVGSGLDIVYPQRHRDLWHAVAERGLLLSEAPLGVRPVGWRFPARNRLIAALARVVVVVESHAKGGSLHTVDEAIVRGLPVLAVPGSVRSPSAAGTNQLISEGCHPVRDAGDVLVALGLACAGPTGQIERRRAPDADGRALLDGFDWEPVTLEHLVVRTGLSVPTVSLALHRLVEDGWVEQAGPWYERVGR